MIEHQDDWCLREIAEKVKKEKYGLEWNEGYHMWDWDSSNGNVTLAIYDDENNKLDKIIYDRKALAKALKSVGYENPESWGAESYINPITGQPNFVLISEHIRDGEYERYEYFVIDAESEAKMSDKEILEWQYGEGSVDESGYGDNEFWVHGERLHEIEAQPISLSDALVLERLRIASRNYPYQDLKK